MTKSPMIKGWCPGAFRPMMSVDGLVMRIRPRMAQLDPEQVAGLCELSLRFGSGMIDLTNRANLQIRGVAQPDHSALLAGLTALGLLDPDASIEQKRNILVTPFWRTGDLTDRLTTALMSALDVMPELPAKVGFAVDTGPSRVLSKASADFRFERSDQGIILRADGADKGQTITEEDALPALIEMVRWFNAHRSEDARRMHKLVAKRPLPQQWLEDTPVDASPKPQPHLHPMGALIGAPFGQIEARALADTMQLTGARGLRVTPWRMLLLEDADMPISSPFSTQAGDALMAADACPGAPFCPQATVPTREIAREIAAKFRGSLHVSGCAKGCARAAPADVALVGNDGAFDLVVQGCAWDAPTKSGLSPEDARTGSW